MLKLKQLILHPSSTRAAILWSPLIRHREEILLLPSRNSIRRTTYRFLDIYQFGSKEAIEKERARLSDEMSRGYFADMSELKKHGGKIAMANKIIIPAMAAVRFPPLEVSFSDGRNIKLPICLEANEVGAEEMAIPVVSLLCLSFRASSQAMINSWSFPFQKAFSDSNRVQLYEVCFIDSWFLSLKPIKQLLLRIMRKPNTDVTSGTLQRQIVYSFGDHYYFRKELKILNLLTGYVFLQDRFGRIRWQGFGTATEEEVASLLACASLLLEEK